MTVVRHAFLMQAALLAAVAALAACGQQDAARGPGGKPVAVVTTTLAPQDWIDTIEALGTARANESVTLTAKVTEVVERVNFEDGDRVEAGQVLVDLSGRAEVAQLEEARAAYKEAQQQYQRQAGLVEQGTIPRSQLDAQVALRDAARARMDAIRARLEDRVITAPFNGVLGFRQVSPGSMVAPGTVIATLDDVSTIKLDFSVPETFLAAIRPGQTIVAKSAAFPDRAFAGTVATVDSRVDPVTRAVTVRAHVPNPDAALKPGMLLTVELRKPARPALVIPELALTQVGTDAFVYRVKPDATVEQVKVATGARRLGEVEVTDGLAPGDRIVVEGTVKLRPGARVAAVERSAAATTASQAPDAP
jgi:membrane fusion protein (multidrug efflux system)